MKKFLMLLAVAGFFSMTVISCGGGNDHDGDDQEQHDDHDGGDEHGGDEHAH